MLDVDLDLAPGEVRALVGKNGAGKSTLVRILSGAVRPDSGSVSLAGRPVSLGSPAQARALGIATVHQDFSLVPELSVAENIMLNRWGRLGLVSRSRIGRIAVATLALLGVDIDPDARVGQLSIADRQVVEIAKSLVARPSVLILDEPSSSLSADEIETLLDVIRRLSTEGVAVIYVTHRLQEIPRVADTVTVLRDGEVVGTRRTEDAPLQRIAEMMVGGTWELARVRDVGGRRGDRPVALSVRGLAWGHRLWNVTFDLHEGEVLGIAGAVGSGRSELLRCIFGLEPGSGGRVAVHGQVLARRRPYGMLRRGVALTPDDRRAAGLVQTMSVADNLILASLGRVSRRGLISRHRTTQLATRTIRQLSIRAPGPESSVEVLSGGNQQKVVVGKWLNAGVRVLLMDEPTKGIDIHAKEQMYELLREMARGGMAVLFVPSELDELFMVCDRIVILANGVVAGDRRVDETDLSELVAMTTVGG